ncbi:MAG: hypothetical protein HDQ44_03775 [Desulfovibrio sp.]|nr:hypothetical protein [Desulfovibrio sp.]
MKKIQLPDLKDALILTPAQMNRIHFAGIRSSLTPEQLKKMAASADASASGGQAAACEPAKP